MAKFHINPLTGVTGSCRAEKDGCPFGAADEHYPSEVEARAAFEHSMENLTVKKLSKKTKITLVDQPIVRDIEEPRIEPLDAAYGFERLNVAAEREGSLITVVAQDFFGSYTKSYVQGRDKKGLGGWFEVKENGELGGFTTNHIMKRQIIFKEGQSVGIGTGFRAAYPRRGVSATLSTPAPVHVEKWWSNKYSSKKVDQYAATPEGVEAREEAQAEWRAIESIKRWAPNINVETWQKLAYDALDARDRNVRDYSLRRYGALD